jgi:peptidyl-prolyl cis-trans isomerase SurA
LRKAFSLLAALGLATGAVAEEVVDGIAAQVGSEIVLISEVRQLSDPVERSLRERGAPESELVKVRATILDRLIERRLIQIMVRRAELGATDAEVDDTLERIAQENGIALEQIRASVEALGLSYEAYRERIRGEIEQAKIVNGMVAAGVRVEDDEVRALYEKRYADQPTEGEEVHLRQIIVAVARETPAARREACGEVEDARERVLAGEDFGRIAREVSDLNAATGGDVGWVLVDSLADWMRNGVDDLQPGEVSGVLTSPYACSLLELVDRRVYEPLTFEQAEEVLRAELFDLRMQEEYLEFVDKIREQTYVERKGIYADATPDPNAPTRATGSRETPGP